MRKTRALFFISLLLVACVQCFSIDSSLRKHVERWRESKPPAEIGKMVLRVHCDKREYSLGETIELAFSLENSDTIAFNVPVRFVLDSPNKPPSLRNIFLEINSPGNKILPFRVLIFNPPPVGDSLVFMLLEPGEKIDTGQIAINQYYDIDSVGNYVVIGFYENYLGEGFGYKDVWFGKIQSETIEFEVVGKQTK